MLVKLKVSREVADRIFQKIWRSCWARSEATGFTSGIWVFWLNDKIKIEVRHAHKYFLHLVVTLMDRRKWDLMAVYATPNASRRRSLWSILDQISVEGPWALIGDFNCVLKAKERSTDGGVSSNFVQWVECTSLIDLEYSGPMFTWSYGVTMQTRKEAHLDRALYYNEWQRFFPLAIVRHLSHAHSDHCSLLLSLKTDDGSRKGDRPFRFTSAWL